MLYPVELQPQEPKTGHSILFFSAECKGVSPLTQIPIRGHAVDFVAVLPPKWK